MRPRLPGCATCAVLVISRQRFALPGLSRLDLDPMQPGDARALLQTLAPRLNNDQADTIAKLCGRLPLALRVAGNYLDLNNNYTPAHYAALLADEKQRLPHLHDPDDPNLDVEATIALSVNQLDAEARQAWTLLGFFHAPFDASAAALWDLDVGAGSPRADSAALERLQVLRNRSLVSYDAETGRFDQHDLLRLAAQHDLDVGAGGPRTPSAARDRLARHYLAVARQVGQTQHHLALDPDWPHLQAALEYAASADGSLLSDLVFALADYFDARGLTRDKVVWCQQAAGASASAGRRQDEVGHLGNLGSAYYTLGDMQQAFKCYEQQSAIAQETGDRRGQGYALWGLGLVSARLRDAQQAIAYCEWALAIFGAIEDPNAEKVRKLLADLNNDQTPSIAQP